MLVLFVRSFYAYAEENVIKTGRVIQGGNLIRGYLDGRLEWEAHYKNGRLYDKDDKLLNGVIKTNYHDNGKPAQVQFYKNGYIEEIRDYHNNGNLARKIFYKDSNDVSPITGFYVYSENVIEYEESGKPVNGIRKEYYKKSGNLYIEQNFKDGIQEGFRKMYHEDGNLMSEANFKANKISGLSKTYTQNGKLMQLAQNFYKNNIHYCTITTYYENGKIRSIASFKGFLQDGAQLEYSESGEIISEMQYQDGKLLDEKGQLKNGEYKTYYSDGNLKSVGYYEKGDLVGKFVQYFKNGKIEREENYRNGKLDGESRDFDKNGELRSIRRYRDGIPESIS